MEWKGDNTISIKNENLFTNLSEYDFRWFLTEDGNTIQEGTQEVAVEPLTTEDVTLPIEAVEAKAGSKYVLKCEFQLKEDTQWANAGYPLIEEEFELDFGQGAAAAEDLTALPAVTMKQKPSQYPEKASRLLLIRRQVLLNPTYSRIKNFLQDHLYQTLQEQ